MEIKKIPLSQIMTTFNSRERGNEASVAELMADIKRRGLRQPIGLAKRGDKYTIVWGNRRLEAFKKLGKNEIPANIVDVKEDGDLIIENIAENLHREDVSPFELGYAINELTTKHKLLEEEVAARLSISVKKVSDYLDLFKFIPKEFRNKVKNRKGRGRRAERALNLSTAIEIARCMRTSSKVRLTKVQSGELIRFCYENKVAASTVASLAKRVHSGQSLFSQKKEKAIQHLVVSTFVEREMYLAARGQMQDSAFKDLLRTEIKDFIRKNALVKK